MRNTITGQLSSSVLRIIFFLILFTNASFSQNTLKGKVEYTAVNQKIKIKRGSNYRDRGNDVKEEKSPEKVEETKAINTIILVKPLYDSNKLIVKTNATLKQRDKSFVPHVLAITVGSSVTFTNEDDFFHNVFSLSSGNKFNLGRKKPKVEVNQTFKKPGLIKVFCDIHPQMNAYILCLDTPYFTNVDEKNHYQLDNLPNGRYLLQFFNPDVEIEDEIIELSGGIVMEKNFIISADKTTGSIDYDTRWYAASCCAGTMCGNNHGE
jgi:plastocyanin